VIHDIGIEFKDTSSNNTGKLGGVYKWLDLGGRTKPPSDLCKQVKITKLSH
jgi:hypothetical protein